MEEKCALLVKNRDESFFEGTYLYYVINGLKINEEQEIAFIREVFYSLISRLYQEESLKNFLFALVSVSTLLRSRVDSYGEKERLDFFKKVYDTYINALITNYRNGNYETASAFLLMMNEKIKMLSGYYGLYGLQEETFDLLDSKYLSGGTQNVR